MQQFLDESRKPREWAENEMRHAVQIRSEQNEGLVDYRAPDAPPRSSIAWSFDVATTHETGRAQIRHISTRGLQGSTSMSLDVGSMIRVRLPGLPWTWARVQWIREEYFGLFMTKALPLKALQQRGGSEKIPSAQPRYDVNIRARIASPLISRIVTILNISTNGLQFETGLPIAPGHFLSIALPGDLHVTGCIRWSEKGRCGVLFDNALSRASLNLLLSHGMQEDHAHVDIQGPDS